MSTLTTDRIRETATKLGLTHIAEAVTQLVDRAEDADMGYLDLIDLLLEEEPGQREGRRSATPSTSPGSRTTRPLVGDRALLHYWGHHCAGQFS